MDFKMHEYTHIIVSKMTPRPDRADINDSKRQYDCYLRLLSELNLEIIEIDAGSSFPENVILEDIAIVCHGIALLLKPKTGQEQLMKSVKQALENDLGLTVIELSDPDAKLLGSDVLFTGREFFVGICQTSNEAGARAIAAAFPEFPCTPIKVRKSAQHLKKYVTVAGPDILCVAASEEAQELLKRMERESCCMYRTLTVPEEEAANCLFINGTLIHRAIEEIPQSFKIFCEKIDFARRSICFSKLAMISSGLSACCLLIRKPLTV